MHPIAYLNGDWIAANELCLPVTDVGFVQGVTVAEQLRTFAGTLFQLQPHLDRLDRSLRIVGVSVPGGATSLTEPASELVERNYALLEAGDDLGLCIFVTPGDYSTFADSVAEPRVAMHTFPVPFRLWANLYDQGQILSVPSVRQVPNSSWPAELKCRSRMHYYLADREAAQKIPAARALILDQQDHVLETSTANIIAYFEGHGLVSPPNDSVLPGISISFLKQVASSLGIGYHERVLSLNDLARADEVYLTSTSPCVLPVVRCDDIVFGTGCPGPVYASLLQEWSNRVDCDIRQQALDFSKR
jgi:branched-subunit amino acid aminotransferase/4-amino-4-deoxychorismate lyase